MRTFCFSEKSSTATTSNVTPKNLSGPTRTWPGIALFHQQGEKSRNLRVLQAPPQRLLTMWSTPTVRSWVFEDFFYDQKKPFFCVCCQCLLHFHGIISIEVLRVLIEVKWKFRRFFGNMNWRFARSNGMCVCVCCCCGVASNYIYKYNITILHSYIIPPYQYGQTGLHCILKDRYCPP